MRTVSIFKNARNQAIRIPKDMEFEGVTELEIRREGDTLLLRPVRPTWLSLASEPHADADFLVERPAVVELGRFDLPGADDDARTESDR
ncbi:type II toxin-antitoxin system VapB family antitoxin [Burkholderia ambifaria]|uniref:AbrB/MazE/SpoVT family DNA-binding domain-containing protein n=1 Tax=Burkholderia ambifaria TaxID=152480 RepID=A0AA41E4X6_9BURK|nr:type II toxin-antitoxin system VapB family antitoxin [Burkholderia ambifaria]MBR8128516.1 AbrB/MazE/SpoVT family DNA-binding domain-containing protein [Burkholderia ambifaria]PRD93142.1 AbrB family transcriptional regulator [Burkholderia ambifaria]